MCTGIPSYRGHRYPVEIIDHCVWLYFRFPLSFRDVEELILERGVVLSYETIPPVVRQTRAGLRQSVATTACPARPRMAPRRRLHPHQRYPAWRAVDQHGNIFDVLVQSHRNALAAKKFFRRLHKSLEYVPRVIVTDKLGRYQMVHREPLESVEHRQSKYLNNRAENSHQPTRQRERERAMKRFTSPGHAHSFLSAFGDISQHFRPNRHRLSAPEWRTEMADRFAL